MNTIQEPLELDLRFEKTSHGVMISGEGHDVGRIPSVAFNPPFTLSEQNLLDSVLRLLDSLQVTLESFSEFDIARLESLGISQADGYGYENVTPAVGRRIFAALCSSQKVRDALVTLQNMQLSSGRALYVRLHFPADGVELAALPWELLWEENHNSPFLFRTGRVSVTRHIDLPEALPPLSRMKEPLRILPIVAYSGVSSRDRLLEEQARGEALRQLAVADKVRLLETVTPATYQAVVRALEVQKPDIVHIVANGTFDTDERTGVLMLDKLGGGEEKRTVTELYPHLQGVHMVTLIACKSAAVQGGTRPTVGLLTGIAPALSMKGVPIVLGMQFLLTTEASHALIGRLYRGIAKGESVQDALYEARKVLQGGREIKASWFVPALYVRSREMGPLYLIPPAVAEKEHRKLFEAYLEALIRTCQRPPFIGLSANNSSSVSGALDIDEVFIPLKAKFQLDLAKQSLPQFNENDDELPAAFATKQYVFLTGEPGSGKSTLLRFMALHMALAYNAASDDERESQLRMIGGQDKWGEPRLPLLINMADFATWLLSANRQKPAIVSLVEYLFEKELIDGSDYQSLEAVLRAGRVLLLLDELDRIEFRDWDLVKALLKNLLNALSQEAKCIISCRSEDYKLRFLDDRRVMSYELLPLSTEERKNLVDKLVASATQAKNKREFFAELERKPQLRPLMQTPLMLTMLIQTTLQQRDFLPERRVLLYERSLQVMIHSWRERLKRPENEKPSDNANSASVTAISTSTKQAIGQQEVARTDRGPSAFDWLATLTVRIEILCLIAYAIHGARGFQGQRDFVYKSDVRGLLRSYLGAKVSMSEEDIWSEVNILLEELDKAGEIVQVSLPEGRYMFAHSTVQEYLTGHALLLSHVVLNGEQADTSRDLISRALLVAEHETWRSPLLFMAERLVEERSERFVLSLVSDLLKRARGDQTIHFVSLAAELLAEVGFERVYKLGASSIALWKQTRELLYKELDKLKDSTQTEAVFRLWQALSLMSSSATVDLRWAAPIEHRTEVVWEGRVYRSERFSVAQYPVTVGQFRKFVREGPYRARTTPDKDLSPLHQFWNDSELQWLSRRLLELSFNSDNAFGYQPESLANPALNHDTQPVVHVSWYEAAAFCRWLTYTNGQKPGQKARSNRTLEVVRLPTAREWELAARGARSNTTAALNRLSQHLSRFLQRPTPVGIFQEAKSNCGAYDMIGNIWQWCASSDEGDDSHTVYHAEAKNDGVGNSIPYIVRGGEDEAQVASPTSGGDEPSESLETTGTALLNVRVCFPGDQKHDVGFRVVKSRLKPL